MTTSKAIRSWLASFIFLALVVGLIFFLTFLEIPEKNKDLITSIIGMLVGSMSMAISIFVGRDPDDVADLKRHIEELNDDRNTLIARLRDAQIDKDSLRQSHDHFQNQVIDKLSVFVGRERLLEIGSGLPKSVEAWMPEQRTVKFSDKPSPISSPASPVSKVSPRDFQDFDRESLRPKDK